METSEPTELCSQEYDGETNPSAAPAHEDSPLPCQPCPVDSWDEAKKILAQAGPRYIFRGQANEEWPLQSSLERNVPSDSALHRPSVAEGLLLKAFSRAAENYLSGKRIPLSPVEWLALMQHYGAPTRFLDWTQSPYIAAYFALEGVDRNDNRHSCVWGIDPDWCRTMTYNQIRCTYVHRSGIAKLDPIVSSDAFAKLFIEPLEPRVRCVFPVFPAYSHERLSIQQGIFLCRGDVDASFQENLAVFPEDRLREKLIKVIIPHSCARVAMTDLLRMNVTRASLFPGLDGFASSLRFDLSLGLLDRNLLNMAQ